MKITVFGAAGDVGSRVVQEALLRGHDVVAVVRSKAQFDKLPTGVTPQVGDAANIKDVARLAKDQDLAISAIRPPTGKEDELVPLTKAILDGSAQSNTRVLIVGGAASLKISSDSRFTVLTAPNFLPDDVVPIARACAAQFDLIANDAQANWSYACPPAMLSAGARTGSYRLGTDTLVADADGNSAISMEDFAVALMDEAEQVKHRRTRFTAAY